MKSASNVNKAAIIAMNPENGKLDQGNLGRHGSDNADVASGSMCTKPVDKMTPAAKAFVAEKKPESDLRIRQLLPTNGTATPMNPANSMQAMATNLRIKAVVSSQHASSSGDSLQPLVDIDMKSFLETESVSKPELFSPVIIIRFSTLSVKSD
ncbi:hypothetical protein Hanom_Chr17g01534221 [Helianthus anomalus]